jgi:K+-sensing histidine kinase KdpD
MQRMNESLSFGTHPFEDGPLGTARQELISGFLTNISSEFRTPLAALNACVEYLLNDFDSLSRDEIGVLLQSIHLSVTGLSMLIENLIQGANINTGQFLIRTGSIDLGEVVTGAIRFMQPLITRRHQQVHVTLPDSLPLVKGDPARLTQVMVNLLSNASKIGPMDQTIAVILEVGSEDEVRVNVVDQGWYFLCEEWGLLIDYFQKPADASLQPYGIWLAISVARKIIEEHGGKMGVQKLEETSVDFWFTVPTDQKYRRGYDDKSNRSYSEIAEFR